MLLKISALFALLIIISIVIATARLSFSQAIRKQADLLMATTADKRSARITADEIASVPAPVQHWLRTSGALEHERIQNVHLKQKGSMRLRPADTKWMPCVAEQFVNALAPGFIWSARIKLMPLVNIIGRDKYVDGIAEIRMKLLSLVNIACRKDLPKLNQGALQRYLSEICWYPSAAVSPYITWEAIDQRSARATMHYKGVSGSVTFFFKQTGDIAGCSAMRYKDADDTAAPLLWTVTNTDYATFHGIRVPVRSTVTWSLPDADFTWYKLEISQIDYNIDAAN